MLFNTVEFLFGFLPLVLGVFVWLNRRSAGQSAVAFLALASIVFYAWWDVRYVVLLLLSMAWNWACGTTLMKKPSRLVLTVGIAINLALLAYYKYSGFFMQTVRDLTGLAWAL